MFNSGILWNPPWFLPCLITTVTRAKRPENKAELRVGGTARAGLLVPELTREQAPAVGRRTGSLSPEFMIWDCFCYLFVSVNFFDFLLLKRTCRFPQKEEQKKKHAVAFCVYIVLFLKICCSLILWFKAEMKYINFFKKTHQISGYHKLYYITILPTIY